MLRLPNTDCIFMIIIKINIHQVSLKFQCYRIAYCSVSPSSTTAFCQGFNILNSNLNYFYQSHLLLLTTQLGELSKRDRSWILGLGKRQADYEIWMTILFKKFFSNSVLIYLEI